MLNAKVTGRSLTFSPATLARNPNLFGARPAKESMPSAKPAKRIRQDSKPLMNELETSFHERLKDMFPCNQVTTNDVTTQAIRFRLGNGIWYKPDFVVFSQDGIRAYEVKGQHAFRGGFENLKVAASLYRAIRFKLVWQDGHQWKEQEVLP